MLWNSHVIKARDIIDHYIKSLPGTSEKNTELLSPPPAPPPHLYPFLSSGSARNGRSLAAEGKGEVERLDNMVPEQC